MKLYATITSERATKGQGGNKYIDIQLLIGSSKDSQDFGFLRLTEVAGEYCLFLDGKIIKTKAKRQKGEINEDEENAEIKRQIHQARK